MRKSICSKYLNTIFKYIFVATLHSSPVQYLVITTMRQLNFHSHRPSALRQVARLTLT